ncbi:MAG: TonB-dependent receptor [Proteobacteria bacterium]|nr:TonB-dependent receptor [Pseudomonadota bacterium]
MSIKRIPLYATLAIGLSCLLAAVIFKPSLCRAEALSPVSNRDTPEADAPRFELEAIVVTGSRIEESARSLPKNVTVITSEDIEQAPGNDVIEVLARESGICPRNLFGHDKGAGLDLRGMGDTSVSNVVVMVDGFRLNPADMAGADLSSIPLDRIERIEIVRGAGSVVYGDGAVGGVINIITKKPPEKFEGRVLASFGSYGAFDSRARLGGRKGGFHFLADAQHYESQGFRDNGFLTKRDASLRLGLDLMPRVTLSLNVADHSDEYGLPGPVSKSEAGQEDRRAKTSRPDDEGETEERRWLGGLDLDMGAWGELSLKAGYRRRDNTYLMGYSSLLPKENQLSLIEERSDSWSLDYVKTYRLAGREHRFQFGYDFREAQYVRTERAANQRENGLVENEGFFLTNKWRLTDRLDLSAGFRSGAFDGVFRSDARKTFGVYQRWVNGNRRLRAWRHSAWDLGLTWTPFPDTTLFASYATSFRSPNVDEFALADDDLRPQTGAHIELGARKRIGGRAELSASLFQTRITDEIYYGEDPRTGQVVNRNYEEATMRQGVETDFKWYPADSLYVWGNLTWLEARFEKKRTRVPLVPRYKTSLGLEWRFSESWLLALTGSWIGSRYDGNDPDNNLYDKLPGYKVFDCKLTWERGRLKAFLGINNLFDEWYSTAGYSETYYPMPARNLYAGLSWSF